MLDDDEHNYSNDRYSINRLRIPTWGFILLFLGPSIVTLGYLSYNTTLDTTATAIIALAVMNGSINSVIAWMTIRLDGHSNDAIEHMDEIMMSMENLDDTMEEASEMVTNFNTDLEEAKSVFAKVGVDLTELDLEPLAEVVEKLKENKDGFTEILDNLKEIDVTHYINQAKRIDWQTMLDSAEEIMGFIQARNDGTLNVPKPAVSAVTLPKIGISFEAEDDDTFFGSDTPNLTLTPPSVRSLNLTPPKRD
jgi:hypothetical protein|tara:strand:- start:1388 stop:2137 length:750 start_codon:yes stop_codon:yes gene_type:complete